jgi:hypothetical protein
MPRTRSTRPKGSGTPAGGPGWGGPAKGASTAPAKPVALFQPGNPGAPPGIPRSEQAAILKDLLFGLATTSDNPAVQVRAAEALLNRIEGMPVARNININADALSTLDDAALEQRRAQLARELGEGDGGATPPPGPALAADVRK